MNREQFFNYIVDNFDISGEAQRLIDNILRYIEQTATDETEQYNMAVTLLDGTIGLTDNELKKIAF